MSRRQDRILEHAPPSVADLTAPPACKPPEVRAAEIIAASLDRVAAALEKLAEIAARKEGAA